MTERPVDRESPEVIVVAFYLPQYHPVPENDRWWGSGFTEWTNVARATRRYPGHKQPDLPGELGFYDLRLPEVREAQAELARAHGVSVFCYWHYWFGGGQRMLERPFAEVLASGGPDFPFCLGWANQSWTGSWHGAPDRILIGQTYPGPDDEADHFASLLPAFSDDRYFRIDGRPLLYVFRPEGLPDPTGFVERWQAMAERAGLGGLYLVAECLDLLGGGPTYTRDREDGFDAAVYVRLPAQQRALDLWRMRALRRLGLPELYPYSPAPLPEPQGLDTARHHPCVYPNWDNTPRCGRAGLVLHGSRPELFRIQVGDAVKRAQRLPAGERLLWVKSWNEWAEGNHLEPDLQYGRGWLEALRTGLASAPGGERP